ncbi:MAG TPA: hypothetical protein VFX43_09420 [Chitinophagaceae bacterium]|nr:hypothetical protein [Chitinophagaceae bacterium]
MSNNVTSVPLLQNHRQFPMDSVNLRETLNKMYLDVATTVNLREIAVYDVFLALNGQQWFSSSTDIANRSGLSSSPRRQGQRQVFTFDTINAGATKTIIHGISGITLVTRLYGNVITANPDFRPLPFSDITNVTNQISIYNDATNIYVINGATAPQITSGFVVLEFLQQ